ncbi:MAG: adenylate/guanylate cyclase domain-containing protein [Armatimonadetes bacterium]|nr:adenylate/guanylate cyclase domain-containing protein [Armatimonadota bacterium]
MRTGSHRYLRRRAAGLLVSLVLGAIAVSIYPRLEPLERRTWDSRFIHRGARATSSQVVIVAIDEKSADYEPWLEEPQIIWGPHYAAAIQNLNAWGARAIGFDYVQRVSTQALAERFGLDVTYDQHFAQALLAAPNVVLAAIHKGSRLILWVDQLLWPAMSFDGRENIAIANYVKGETADLGVVRSFEPLWDGQPALRSFALRLVERAAPGSREGAGQRAERQGARSITLGQMRIPLYRDGTVPINYVGPPGSIPTYSFCDIAEGRKPPGADFQGKVVIIGEAYFGTQDLHLTPYSAGQPADKQDMYGAEVWANAVATLLDRRFLAATEVPTGRAILLALALGSGVLFLGTGLGVGAAICVLSMALWQFACHWLFRAHDYLLLMYAPLALIPGNYFAITAYRFFTEEREKQQIKRMWERYLNPALVRHLLEHPEDQALGGKRTAVTVLFSDIRGFTAMSERMTAQQVVRILNEYLTEMTEVVMARGGVVDKYVGDAIMAFWGAPLPCEDGPERAVRTALGMMEALARLNERWRSEGVGQLEIGVGINTGEAVFGNIGSPHKMDFTLIGDTVNLASRLESLTKELRVGIIIGEATAKQLGPQFRVRALPSAMVRGVSDLVAIYTVDGVAQTTPPTPEPPASRPTEAKR